MDPKQIPLRRVLRTTRLMTDARAILDMLGHRLREDGPKMTRAEIRERVLLAAEKLNQIVPRSPLREGE